MDTNMVLGGSSSDLFIEVSSFHSGCPGKGSYSMYMYMYICSVIETRQRKATMPKDDNSFSQEKELPQAGLKPVY